MKTNFIEAGKTLEAAIVSIKNAGKKLDGNIQTAAMSAAKVVLDTGNIMYVNSLYLALGKGARHVAMTAWLTTFAGVTANDGESKDTKPFVFDKNKTVDLESGEKTPWFDMKASPKPDDVLDVYKLLLATIKRATKPKEGQEVTGSEILPELQALAEKYAPKDEEATAGDDTATS